MFKLLALQLLLRRIPIKSQVATASVRFRAASGPHRRGEPNQRAEGAAVPPAAAAALLAGAGRHQPTKKASKVLRLDQSILGLVAVNSSPPPPAPGRIRHLPEEEVLRLCHAAERAETLPALARDAAGAWPPASEQAAPALVGVLAERAGDPYVASCHSGDPDPRNPDPGDPDIADAYAGDRDIGGACAGDRDIGATYAGDPDTGDAYVVKCLR